MSRPVRPFGLVLAAFIALALVLIQTAHAARAGDSASLPAGWVMTELGPAELCGAAERASGDHGAMGVHCPDCLAGSGAALSGPAPAGPLLPAFGAADPCCGAADDIRAPARFAAAPFARGPPLS